MDQGFGRGTGHWRELDAAETVLDLVPVVAALAAAQRYLPGEHHGQRRRVIDIRPSAFGHRRMAFRRFGRRAGVRRFGGYRRRSYGGYRRRFFRR